MSQTKQITVKTFIAVVFIASLIAVIVGWMLGRTQKTFNFSAIEKFYNPAIQNNKIQPLSAKEMAVLKVLINLELQETIDGAHSNINDIDPKPFIVINAEKYYADYTGNQSKADFEYKSKKIFLRARISSITSEKDGNYNASLAGVKSEPIKAKAYFTSDQRDYLSKQGEMQRANLYCIGDGISDGVVVFRNCTSFAYFKDGYTYASQGAEPQGIERDWLRGMKISAIIFAHFIPDNDPCLRVDSPGCAASFQKLVRESMTKGEYTQMWREAALRVGVSQEELDAEDASEGETKN